MTDIIIIGNGPAGLSASAYTVRAGMSTLVIGRDQGALGRAEKIENYFGFTDPVSGGELVTQGIGQARRLGAEVITDEVTAIDADETLTVRTLGGTYEARAVILATGASRMAPPIPGLKDYEGRGVSYCAVCDGFFYRGRDVAVLGEGAYALHEAMELKPLARSVTLLTNGKEPAVAMPQDLPVVTAKIQSVSGGETLERVTLDDGREIALAGLFVAIGVAGSADLAKRLGAETDGPRIVVDETMASSVPGVFAAGDCVGGMSQVAKAVYDGAKAGTSAVKYIRSKEKNAHV